MKKKVTWWCNLFWGRFRTKTQLHVAHRARSGSWKWVWKIWLKSVEINLQLYLSLWMAIKDPQVSSLSSQSSHVQLLLLRESLSLSCLNWLAKSLCVQKSVCRNRGFKHLIITLFHFSIPPPQFPFRSWNQYWKWFILKQKKQSSLLM
jgi:hypothetical protein